MKKPPFELTDNILNLIKQISLFHDRQANEEAAWTFCWGYVTALEHNNIITHDQRIYLSNFNDELFKQSHI